MSLNVEQAIEFCESGEWQSWSDADIVEFQLSQNLICIPFGRFHQAVERVLGRPVLTHEFMRLDLLLAEYKQQRKEVGEND